MNDGDDIEELKAQHKREQDQRETRTIYVVLAVLITAGVVWVAKDGRAPDCGYGVVPDSPGDCTINYYIWKDQAFPNQSYFRSFELDGSEQALFDACTSFTFATLGTPEEWASNLEDVDPNTTVPDRVVDACRQWVSDHGIPVVGLG